ncbi:MAG: patatin-like protein [Myxococcaceae bacterium]|nr:patatin-like protein [Myxococcaceae bacterium]
MGETKTEVSEAGFDREVRLGLVLYGGVSLAVYIGGVVRELFDAVHGRGVYKLLRALIGSQIKVDVISGTSAGGINGVLLAFALANNLELEEVAKLWREHGDLEKLMRGIGEPNPPSLLDGEGYFQPRLEEALGTMLAKKIEGEAPVDAIDVFVTATDFHGQLGFVLDNLNDVISVKDHRRVFQLKFRKGRANNDLVPPKDEKEQLEWKRALATVCRSTATFPGAFEPVEVPADERKFPGRSKWHHWLHDWSASKSPGDFVLVDGGVIDNKPFTHTLKAIYARTTEREVDRRLIFCEPDPENFDPVENEVPDFTQVVTASLSTLPGYETISDDLQSLADHNARVASYQSLVKSLPASELPKQTQAFRQSFYVNARIIAYTDKALTEIVAARQGSAAARRENDGQSLDAERARLAEVAKRVRSTARVDEEFLRSFDVGFRQRRLFHVVYELYDRLYDPKRVDRAVGKEAERIRQLLPLLNRQLQFFKIIDWVDTEWREEFGKNYSTSDTDQVWPMFYRRLAFLFSPVKDPEPKTPEALYGVLLKRLRSLQDPKFSVPEVDPPALLDQIEALLPVTEPSYVNFERLDELTYPIESLAHLEQKDAIETLRISPRDAQLGYCRREAYDKVTGEALGHFGAFLKRSWRSNDIMWGRLDSTTLLIQDLLSSEAVERARTQPSELLKLVADTFKNTTHTSELKTLEAWLERLAADRGAASKELEQKGCAVHEALAKLAQEQIISQELGNVLYDAVKQGSEWGTVPPDDGGLDSHVATWSATQVKAAKVTLEKSKGAETPSLAPATIAFSDYAVGTESLTRDVPPIVLLRLVMHTALVMQRVLGQVLGKKLPLGMSAALTPVLAAIRWVAFFGYAFALTGRIKPVTSGFALASVAALVASVPMRSLIWQKPDGVDWWLAVPFVFVPVAYVTLYLLVVQRSWVRWVSAAVFGAGIGLGAALWKHDYYKWLTDAVAAALKAFHPERLALGLTPMLLIVLGGVVLYEPWRRRRKKATARGCPRCAAAGPASPVQSSSDSGPGAMRA